MTGGLPCASPRGDRRAWPGNDLVRSTQLREPERRFERTSSNASEPRKPVSVEPLSAGSAVADASTDLALLAQFALLAFMTANIAFLRSEID